MVLLALVVAASAQTRQQQETSLAYLRQRACIDATGAAPVVVGGGCFADADCAAPATCLHRSAVAAPASLYPDLEFVDPPVAPGSGEGVLRYVPLCEDGSGDHEHAVSGGLLGTPPTCAPEDFLRCADGTRPRYRAAAGTSNDWIVHFGGGHASAPSSEEDPIWVYANEADSAAAYTPGPTPAIRADFTGIFDDHPANPFRTWNRVKLEKCTPDTWLGNTTLQLTDMTAEQGMIDGDCEDADRSGEPTCADNLARPGACVCRPLAPPQSPGNLYHVFYHGKRIVRATFADLIRGATLRERYPLVDDGSGQAALQPGDLDLPRPAAGSEFSLFCHSNGCVGMEGGHADELRDLLRARLGDIDVSVLYNSAFPPSYEVEWAMSEWDGADADGDGFGDVRAAIDDARSVYDHVVDTWSMTAEPMGDDAWAPGGPINTMKRDWYTPAPGYAYPVDATCLAHHCPGSPDPSADPACTPCHSAVHVLLNHLQAPFVYQAAQTDSVFTALARQCLEPTTGAVVGCDFRGTFSGVDLVDSHFRHGVRKQMADLYRQGATDRCEAASGAGPYDRMLLMSPDWSEHGSLMDALVAARALDLDGPAPALPMALAAHAWLRRTSASSAGARNLLCLEERVPGENAADFGGTVPGCR